MSNLTLFIADLHLSKQQPDTYHRFNKFIQEKARHARALYILGDLFEYYLGDDAMDEMAQRVAKDISELSENYNTKCFFMPGNRDFLLGNEFAEAARLTLLRDPCVINVDDIDIIVTHADELCTDDTEYQKVRTQLRNPDWQKEFLSMSIEQRIHFAQQARQKSREHTQTADSDIMDVNEAAVEGLFKKFNCDYMLHGHTHRPAIHTHIIEGQLHRRMVVGDWHYQISFIEYSNNQFQLVNY